MTARVIKFRAWLERKKSMYEVSTIYLDRQQGFAKTDRANLVDLCGETRAYVVGKGKDFNPVELMQFTGFLDKNGKEVYEGDIVQAVLSDEYGDVEEQVIEEVNYVNGLLCPFFIRVCWDEEWWKDRLVDGFEVIGNIYANPELLLGRDE